MEAGPVTRSRRNITAEPAEKENANSAPGTPVKKTGKVIKTEVDTPLSNLNEVIQDKMNLGDVIASPARITRSRRSLSVCSNPPDSPSRTLLKRAISPNSPKKARTPVRELTAKKTRESVIDKNVSSNEMTPTKRLLKINENSLLTVDSPKPRRTRLSLTESESKPELSNLRRSRRLSTELNVVEEDPIKEAIVEPTNVSLTRKRRTKTLSVIPTEPTLLEETETNENESMESETANVSDKANSSDVIQDNSENLNKSKLSSPTETLNKSLSKVSSPNLNKSASKLLSPKETLNRSSPNLNKSTSKLSSPTEILIKSSPKISSPNLNKSTSKISSPNLNKSVSKISSPKENLNRSSPKISSPKVNLNRSSPKILSPTSDVKDFCIVLNDCSRNSIKEKNERSSLTGGNNLLMDDDLAQNSTQINGDQIDNQEKKSTPAKGMKSPRLVLNDIEKTKDYQNDSILNVSGKLNVTGPYDQSPNRSSRKNSTLISDDIELKEQNVSIRNDLNKSGKSNETESHNQSLNRSSRKNSLVILSDDEKNDSNQSGKLNLSPNKSMRNNLNKSGKLNETGSHDQSLNRSSRKNSLVILSDDEKNDSNQSGKLNLSPNKSMRNNLNKSGKLNETGSHDQSLNRSSRKNSLVILNDEKNDSIQNDLNRSGKSNQSIRNNLNKSGTLNDTGSLNRSTRKNSSVILNVSIQDDLNQSRKSNQSPNQSTQKDLNKSGKSNGTGSPNKSLNRSSRKNSSIILIDDEIKDNQRGKLNESTLSSDTSQSSINNLVLEESPKNTSKRLSAKEIFLNESASETKASEDKKKKNDSLYEIEMMEVDESSTSLIIDEEVDIKKDNAKSPKRKSISDVDKSILSSPKSDDDSCSEDEDDVKDTFLDLAEDAGSDYQSGDSMNESERLDIEENEIIERGHSLNSESDEEDVDDTYEKDSFVCSSDEEDDVLLSGTGDDLSSGEEMNQSSKSKAKYNAKSEKQRKNASREMYSAKHGSANTTKSPNTSGKNQFSKSYSEPEASILNQSDEKEISIVEVHNISKDPLSVTLAKDSKKSLSNSQDRETTESSSDDDEKHIRDTYNEELQKLRNIEYVSDTSSEMNLKNDSTALNKSVKSSPKISDSEKSSLNTSKASKKFNLSSELNKSDSMLTKKRNSNTFNSSLSGLEGLKVKEELQTSATVEENIDRLRRLDESIKNIYSSVINTVDQVKCSVDAVVHSTSNLNAQLEINNTSFNVFKRKLTENYPIEEKSQKKICVSQEDTPIEIQKSAYEVLNTKKPKRKRTHKKADRNSLKLSEKSKTIKRSRDSDVDMTSKKVVNVAAELQAISVIPSKEPKDIVATSNFEVEEVDANKKYNWTGTAGRFHITEKAVRRSIVSDSTTSFSVVSLKKHPKQDIKVENALVSKFVNFKNDMLYGNKLKREPSTNIKKNLLKIKLQQAAYARK
ncbi:uncharacterized protein LOC143917037 [Arctopsyche grandis]|uniref:uncharacterized protein LOC143917037 n=1 Tax=Arctopsyche grandis TaxID=121162 RepID=UPI00406D76CA